MIDPTVRLTREQLLAALGKPPISGDYLASYVQRDMALLRAELKRRRERIERIREGARWS